MTGRILVNGSAQATVSASDRGVAYGDGLFETIRFEGNTAPLWQRHMQRIEEGCRRLRMPAPDVDLLWHEACQVSQALSPSVVRITLTRGVGERGYAPPSLPQPTRIVAGFAAPRIDAAVYAEGIHLRVCDTRLAEQPLLAGLKHLNRLEQVMARAEWDDPRIAEGLLCDGHGRVISATMANVFAMIGGELCTPTVDRCGVAGVARAEVLTVCAKVRVRDIPLQALHDAEEIFLTSSVRGIVSVQSLAGRVHRAGTIVRHLQQHWRSLGFSMEQSK